MSFESKEFFGFLVSPYGEDKALSVELRTFHPPWRMGGKPGPRRWRPLFELTFLAEDAQELAASYDVYFGVLPRLFGKGDAEGLKKAAFLWLDFDAGSGTREETIEFAKERIKALSIPTPNVFVLSGGGCHAYWRLSELVDVNDTPKRLYLQTVLKRFAWAVGGEPDKPHACSASTDPPRILRVPGTFNHKRQGEPRKVELVRVKDGDEKPLVWWTANLPAQPLPPKKEVVYKKSQASEGFELPWLSPQMEAWLTEPAPDHTKHPALKAVACRMRANGESEESILRILTKKAENSGVDVSDYWQQKHIASIVEWVFSHIEENEDRPRFYRGVSIGNSK